MNSLLSPGEYAQLLAHQDGVCAICYQLEGQKQRNTIIRFAVDHDHKTGIIRGLLCSRCNKALGLLRDSPKILKAAIAYLDPDHITQVNEMLGEFRSLFPTVYT